MEESGGLNLCGFVSNQPIGLVDPKGRNVFPGPPYLRWPDEPDPPEEDPDWHEVAFEYECYLRPFIAHCWGDCSCEWTGGRSMRVFELLIIRGACCRLACCVGVVQGYPAQADKMENCMENWLRIEAWALTVDCECN